jgi:serine/threonine-protein kinase
VLVQAKTPDTLPLKPVASGWTKPISRVVVGADPGPVRPIHVPGPKPPAPQPPPEPRPAKVVVHHAADHPQHKPISVKREQKARPLRDRMRLGGDRYELQEMIAAGGSGTVYKAYDSLLQMAVAIKFLKPELLRDPAAVETFKTEARLAMQLSHPHIVRLYNLVKTDYAHYLVMEYVEGRSYRSILAQCGKLPVRAVSETFQACGSAVGHAHRHGVLHNDLKPDNLLLQSGGLLKIIDFGIATLRGVHHRGNYVEGTPAYMSPEQLTGEPLDGRSDQFALGVMACEFLTGALPFPLDGGFEEHVRAREHPDLGAIEPGAREVIARAVNPDRERRWPTAEEFCRALVQALSAKP